MRRERGTTLIELIIAIVVIGICVVSVLALLSSISVRSASSMQRTQATSAAAAYLDAIVAQPYGSIGGYNGIDRVGVLDITGAPVAGLERYRVQVSAVGATLGSGGNSVPAMRVEVTITDPSNVATRITGFRTNHAGQVLSCQALCQ